MDITQISKLKRLKCDARLIKSGVVQFDKEAQQTAITVDLRLREGDTAPVLSALPFRRHVRHLLVSCFCELSYGELSQIYGFKRVTLKQAQNLPALVLWGIQGRVLPRFGLNFY